MAKTIVVTRKKRGPAPTGKGTQVGERWHPAELDAIDAWIASSSNPKITRAHAIRRLVALGLAITAKQPAASRAERAKELAAKAIDKMTDTTASADDQATRKRRLLKGPDEFREDRVDRPKAEGK